MKNMATVLVVLAVLIGGYYVMNMPKDEAVPTDQTMMANESAPAGDMAATSGASQEDGQAMMVKEDIKEFTIESSEMKFDVTEIKVKKGDKVKIILKNVGQYTHDWVVDEFSARTKVIKGGETDEIVFEADQVGTFEYYCSVMQHRKMGMVGKLIVEE